MLRQTAILDMFARSPIRPLQTHMEKAHCCVERLLPFFKEVLEQNWPSASKLRDEISQFEHEADDLKHELRLHLPNNLFLPVARSDLLTLLATQEKLANTSKDIAGIMLGRKMQIPSQLKDQFLVFIERSIDASAQARKAISELDELLESGFRGKEVKLVEKMLRKLNLIEDDADTIERELKQALFTIEKELAPIDAIFLYKIVELVGYLANCAEQTGNQLQILLAR